MCSDKEEFTIISLYTRAQAIADGFLVDVSDLAKEAGFKWPVAVTCAVWDETVTPTPHDEREGQSEKGRLWDVLWYGPPGRKGQHGRPRFRAFSGSCAV